jgi:hypothetical protein
MATSLENLNISGHPYPFKLLCKNKLSNGKLYDYVYTFNSKKGVKYQANAIQYEINVFAIKFHLKLYQKHPNKYSMLTNNGDGKVVLKTIVSIMLDILRLEPNASFAFIGMPLEQENLDTTKRYVIYEKFCKRYFNINNFEHVYDNEKSFYMLLNKKIDTKKIYAKIGEIAESELSEVINESVVSFNRSTT